MNKYLEKIASWKNTVNFVGNVTGKNSRELASKIKHVEEFVANKQNLHQLHRQKAYLDKEKIKTRLQAGAGAAIAAVGGAYGYKKIRDKQDRETQEQYNKLFKTAGTMGAAKELGKDLFHNVGTAVKKVVGTTIDMSNTAAGGKVRSYAVQQGLKPGSAEKKIFNKAKLKDKISILARKNPSQTRDIRRNMVNLHKQKRDAKIALGAAGAAGAAGIVAHKRGKKIKDLTEGNY